MLQPKYTKILAIISGLTLATAAGAQVLIGGFQGAGDPTDAGWVNETTGNPIVSDSECSFPSGVVPTYAQSLAVAVPPGNAGTFGYPSLQLQFSPAQIAAFYTNSWITFTFSVPAWTNGGYSQIYNLVLNAPGYGYNNQSWANALEMGNTNSTNPGSNPNYYFYNGVPEQTMVVSYNYSSVEAAIQAGIANSVATNGPSFLQMTFQGNQGGGAPISPAWYLNSVVLSKAPFGVASEPTASIYVVDDFSTNGVSPSNPTNYDYFDTTNVYLDGQITNVYGNWFGGGFDSVAWSTNNVTNSFDSASYPANGSLQVTVSPANGQWVLHHADYSANLLVNSLIYTDVEMDVRFDPSSIATVSGGTTNYGPIRVGVRPAGVYDVQDWFYYAPVVTSTNWAHIVAPLSGTDPNQQTWGELLVGMDPTGLPFTNGSGTNQIIYVDNIVFKGPLAVVTIPPPTLSVLPATPGLRIFAGSAVNNYDRATISTVNQNESWIGGSYPVTYSFSLLSYPNNNIDQTMLQLVPVNSSASAPLGGNFPAGGNEYFDYQATNGLWLVLSPNGGGAVVASLWWKTNFPNSNPFTTSNTAFASNPGGLAVQFTNSTAIGTWTLTFNNATSGTLTGPGSGVKNFTIADPNVSSDFANPVMAIFGLQPNSTAGEGLWEDWGFVGITGVSGGNISDNWTQQTQDFGSGISPDGNFSAQGSANPPEIIISRKNLDAYWFSWTTPAPAAGFGVVVTTNLLSGPPSTWIDPAWYNNNNDFFPPRANASVLLGPIYVTLMPYDDLPTANGQQQPSPLAPNAFWIGSTNFNNQYP
jgi:hypothetical protein